MKPNLRIPPCAFTRQRPRRARSMPESESRCSCLLTCPRSAASARKWTLCARLSIVEEVEARYTGLGASHTCGCFCDFGEALQTSTSGIRGRGTPEAPRAYRRVYALSVCRFGWRFGRGMRVGCRVSPTRTSVSTEWSALASLGQIELKFSFRHARRSRRALAGFGLPRALWSCRPSRLTCTRS